MLTPNSLRKIGFLLSITLLSACGESLETETPDEWNPVTTPTTPTEPIDDNTGAEVEPIELSDEEKSGLERYTTSCASCHGVKGEGPDEITYTKTYFDKAFKTKDEIASGEVFETNSLSDYITKYMPIPGAANCVGECSDEIAAYIRTWTSETATETPTQPEVPLTLSEKIAEGEILFTGSDLGCQSCHGPEGSSSDNPIDNTQALYTHSTDTSNSLPLAEFITQWMPNGTNGNPEKCVGDCAENLTAYIQSWEVDTDSGDNGDTGNGDNGDAGNGDNGDTGNGDNGDTGNGDTGNGDTSTNAEGKNAAITDTSTTQSGNLTYKLSDNNLSALASGAVSLDVLYPAGETNDLSIVIYDESGKIADAISNVILKSDGRIQLRDTELASGANRITLDNSHTPGNWTNFQLTWNKSNGAAGTYTLSADGIELATYAFNNPAATAVTAFGLKLASNGNTTTLATSIDNLTIYSDTAMTSAVFTDTFEDYVLDEVFDGQGDPYATNSTFSTAAGTPLDGDNTDNGGTETGDTEALIASGKTNYEQDSLGCALCHGATGEGGLYTSLDASKVTYDVAGIDLTLADYISDYMPTLGVDPTLCTDKCADSIAAYIRSWAAQETPANIPPVAISTANVTIGEAPLTVLFNASTSTDTEDATLTYLWEFSDGTTSNLASLNKTFNDADNYTATLTVTDSDNASTTADIINIMATAPEVDSPPMANIVTDNKAGEVPLIVAFDASGSIDNNNIVSYSWNFGDDNATDSGEKVSHTYNKVGLYTATLTVEDDAGQSTSTTTQITVTAVPNVAPVAVATADITSGETPLTVQFEASASSDKESSSLTYSWVFNDGTSSSSASPSKTFTTAGNYTATLTVTDADNASTTAEVINITATSPAVNLAPVAVITNDVSTGKVPLEVNFDASSSTDDNNDIRSYSWNFGDNTAADSGPTASHTYNAVGTFTATLTVTDDAGKTKTTTTVITVEAIPDVAPFAEFTATAATGEAPFAVSFDASGSFDDNNIASYSWNFGDGTAIATGQKVSHTYNVVGEHTATLTVTDDADQSTKTATKITVEATPDSAPTAAFTANATTGEAPFAVSFDASGSDDDNGITAYAWDFGHNASTSNGETSSYTFTEAGVYTVSLTVSDSSNQTHRITQVITVTGPAYVGNALNGEMFYSVLGCASCHGATGTSTFPAAFPDIVPSKTELTHKDAPGVDYTLANYVSTWMPDTERLGECDDKCGEDIAAYILSWVAEEVPVNTPPVAVATADLTSGDTPLTVQFEASASTDAEGSALTYSWLFSDNTSSTSVSPSKTFNTAGNYTATLTVTDSDNASTTANVINITATSPKVDLPPVASFTENVTSGEVPLIVDFDATKSTDDNNVVSYNWDFGDNTATDSGLVVSHTYNTVGTYTATLTVTDDAGKTTATTKVITVVEVPDSNPVAAFTANAATGEAPFAASFDASTSSDDNGVISYSWDFGSSAATADGVTASYTFTEVGVHDVTLTVTDSKNQTHSITQSVTVTAAVTDPGTDPVTPPVAIIGDAINGEAIYGQSCVGCHGETGTSDIFPDIIPGKTVITHVKAPGTNYTLENYIQTWMPKATPGTCDAQCAADLASYIATWETEEVVFATCDLDEIQYGRRQMRLLTSREYENSLKDLVGYQVDSVNVGIPSDTVVDDFANQALTAVTQNYMDAYTSVAAAAATYSFENNFAGVANCTDSSASQCADNFIDDFAMRAYRRPLTDEEADRYRTMFTGPLSSGSNNEALKIAIQAAVSSPYFLYRSEMGESIIDINDRIENGTGELEAGDSLSTLSGAGLGSVDADGYLNIALYQNFGRTLQDHNYTGNDRVTIVAKGVEVDGVLPSIKLSVAQKHIATQILTSADETTYTFPLNDIVGTGKFFQIINDINGAQHAEGRTLSIKSITISDAVAVVEKPIEVELDSDAYVLTPYEVATFIAYTYTGSTPDAALLEAAKNAELSTEDEIKVHITRLMATDKAREHFGEFAAEWLDVDGVLSSSKDATLFPTFTQDVREDMAQEVRDIFKHVMFDENQDIKNIYGDFSFMNKNLADFYGVSGPTSDTFVKVDNLGHRGGVLTSGAFMANYAHSDETSPIKRAVAVRESLLCQHVPPMPANLAEERESAQAALIDFIAENDDLVTNAEFYGFITKDEPCSACHKEIINPHAFGMEDFDPVGLLRTYGTNGKIIDATGRLIGTNTLDDDNSFDFHGARALSEELKELPRIQSCFAQKSFRFVMATGHEEYDSQSDTSPELSDQEKHSYNCALEAMTINMSKNNNNAKAAFEAIGLNSLVLYRKQQ